MRARHTAGAGGVRPKGDSSVSATAIETAPSTVVDEDGPNDANRQVGERLRAIRRQKRLSLQEVEAASALEFKASVLGAYERGERAISVPRLARLARFYEVPTEQLLPDSDLLEETAAARHRSMTIDLRRVQALGGVEGELMKRFLGMIQVQRQDFNGRVLTVRDDDLRAIACILGVRPEHAASRVEELGLRVMS
ncbi:MAG: transcriptional regulator [Acidimicrobiia bacterium]|nr:transcriptional regulator [Acidimicrobiia bacterium]